MAGYGRQEQERGRLMKKVRNPDRERMLKELETIRWDYLQKIADTYEDEGDEIMVLGYRWLAIHKRWPKNHWKRGYTWFYSSVTEEESGRGFDHFLPREVCELLPRWGKPNFHRWTKTEITCLEAAAKALGTWLRKKQPFL